MSEKNKSNIHTTSSIDRRNMLKMAAGTGAAAIAALAIGSCASGEKRPKPAATKGRINHSVAYWCFAMQMRNILFF